MMSETMDLAMREATRERESAFGRVPAARHSTRFLLTASSEMAVEDYRRFTLMLEPKHRAEVDA